MGFFDKIDNTMVVNVQV